MSAPPGGSSGHRMLAAIVFTDVVGYTVLAGRDEAKAIALFRRDSEVISQTCTEYEGQVLKNTGDGLLMCFTSAVQAVTCSIEIQRRLYEQNQTLPKEDVFQHRIGVHLGDVVLMPDDVIGDGVNIANRIQNEARPGGIAISQTVYDVVKNKVKLNATSLGVRNLKHIVEPVTVWSIPPLGLLAQSPYHSNTPAQEHMMESPMPSYAEPKEEGAKGVLLAIGAVLLLLIPIAIFAWSRSQPEPKKNLVTVTSSNKGEDKGKETTDQPKDKPVDEGPKADESGKDKPNPDIKGDDAKGLYDLPTQQEEAPLTELLNRDSALAETLAAYKKSYDFAGAVKWLDDQGYSEAPQGKALRERYEALAGFRAWLESQIEGATSDEPLVLPPLKDPEPTKVWGSPDGGAMVGSGQTVQPKQFADFVPDEIVRIARAALAQSQPGTNKRPKVVVRRWMGIFVRVYGLNERPSD